MKRYAMTICTSHLLYTLDAARRSGVGRADHDARRSRRRSIFRRKSRHPRASSETKTSTSFPSPSPQKSPSPGSRRGEGVPPCHPSAWTRGVCPRRASM